ncbi:hypothetical protein [Alteromonas oceanisediminis]|uniref:hypothetical protein n=1 Tax=Alteromonas oceanisediminis TaxID=2836180 RepID=UPI001BD945AA|nr:hypothetical protein [Alteromonas oceanisediminis]MBT0588156.1 hypothetical protein [Alteromonas oceanisediminis]
MNLINKKSLNIGSSFYRWSMAVLMLILSQSVSAELKFSGFATLAVTHSSHDEIRFRTALLNRTRSNWTVASDSVIGGQINYQYQDRIDFVAQVVIQDRGETDALNYLEKAFMRVNIDRNWSVRVGRMSNNLYLLSEYRPVGYAQAWARPPIDFYSSSSVAAVLDGAEVSYSTDIGGGYAKFSFAYGESTPELGGDSESFSVDFTDLFSLSVEYQVDDWLVRAMYAKTRIDNSELRSLGKFIQGLESIPNEAWPEAAEIAEGYRAEGKTGQYYSVGFKFDNGEWQFQGEAAGFEAGWLQFPDARFAYFSIGYYIDEFLPFVVASSVRPKDPTPNFVPPILASFYPDDLQDLVNLSASITNESLVTNAVDQNSYSVGVRWDFAPDWAFKAQFDHFRIQYPGSGLFGNNDPQLSRSPQQMNVVHLGLTTVF